MNDDRVNGKVCNAAVARKRIQVLKAIQAIACGPDTALPAQPRELRLASH